MSCGASSWLTSRLNNIEVFQFLQSRLVFYLDFYMAPSRLFCQSIHFIPFIVKYFSVTQAYTLSVYVTDSLRCYNSPRTLALEIIIIALVFKYLSVQLCRLSSIPSQVLVCFTRNVISVQRPGKCLKIVSQPKHSADLMFIKIIHYRPIQYDLQEYFCLFDISTNNGKVSYPRY